MSHNMFLFTFAHSPTLFLGTAFIFLILGKVMARKEFNVVSFYTFLVGNILVWMNVGIFSMETTLPPDVFLLYRQLSIGSMFLCAILLFWFFRRKKAFIEQGVAGSFLLLAAFTVSLWTASEYLFITSLS